MIQKITVFIFGILMISCSYDQPQYNPIRDEINDDEQENNDDENDNSEEELVTDIDPDKDFDLVWSEDFDCSEAEFDKNWDSANGPQSWIECGRYRENVEISEGTMKIHNRKEYKNGQNWTSGSVSTKKYFKYGYFECKYKYAAATATNNSFWFHSQGEPIEGDKYEIDVNEGKYPNKVDVNLHHKSEPNWSKGESFYYGSQPGYSHQLETPIKTSKIRFSSTHGSYFHLKEFRIYGLSKNKIYPEPLSETADSDIPELENYAKKASIKVSGSYNNDQKSINLVDGSINTGFIFQNEGEKWAEFTLPQECWVGCIQLVNGYYSNSKWNSLISNYKIQYYDGNKWVDIGKLDVTEKYDFSEQYHTFGLKWTQDSIIYYVDRVAVRKIANEFCHSPSPIIISCAIIDWAGPITDAIDGTKMEVDYVKVYEQKK